MKFDYYNGMHFIFLSIVVALFIVLFFALRRTTQKTKKLTLFGLAVANFAIFTVYKVLEVAYFHQTLYFALPFQLCNLLVMLLPFALFFNKQFLLSIIFFMGVPSAFLALIAPSTFYIGHTFLSAQLWGFMITHVFLFVISLLVMTFGFYKPKMKHAILNGVTLLVYAGLAHVINIVFRVTKVAADCNFFFTFCEDGVLKVFYKLIPVPLLYLVPLIVLACGVFCLETYIFNVVQSKRKKEKNEI